MLFTIFEMTFKEIITTPPGSMFFVLILALLTGLISSLLTKWLVDTEEIERKQRQIKKHGEDKEKIIDLAERDVNRYIKERKKWERKDQILKKTQQRMSLQRLKPTCITFVPMIVIFTLVRILLTNDPVALSPMHANDIPFIGNLIAAGSSIWINFTAWYFLCSLGISTLIQRALKIQTQASGGMGQAFGGSKAKALEFPEI